MEYQVKKTDEEWKGQLGQERFEVLRRAGTERPWTGQFVDCHEDGTYHCAGCGAQLFESGTKFESGSGWPSFYEPIDSEAIETVTDRAHGMSRVEVRCRRCGSHLGHVFEDGPKPTGLRYCMNSLSLTMQPEGSVAEGPVVEGSVAVPNPSASDQDPPATELATFGAGCFWGVEERYRTLPGVIGTAVGYAGGHTEHPSYAEVCSHRTGHAEVVQVTYDPAKVTYDSLLDAFWAMHDPTTLNRQGPDVGDQYRSAVFFHTPEQQQAAEASKARHQAQLSRPIVTEITPAPTFWTAEDYHQKYLVKRNEPACEVPGASSGGLAGAVRGLLGRS